MSGHSKWSTIKRQKGAADIKRGQTFTKVANAIIIAVKAGGSPDPESNPRLKAATDAAKAVNMPKENVQRAIDRGLGKVKGESLEEVIFEGFGPGKVAFLVEGVTDNRLRTLQEVKNLFERSGGSLAGQGSVAYMFDRMGEIKLKTGAAHAEQSLKVKTMEEEILELIDLGAEDVEDFEEPFGSAQGKDIRKYLVYVDSLELNTMSNKITQAGYRVEKAEIVLKPSTTVEINDRETAQKVLDLAQKLEEHDDIQKVYANFDISENLLT